MLLDDDLLLRRATEADASQILELSIEAHGAQEETSVRWMFEREDAGLGAWVVVVDGDRVVSTSVGLQATYQLGDIELPIGQVEYVATDPGYRNRGLVRAIFTELEREARSRGALLHIVEGIPYFYRVLGYGYGLSYPPMRDIAVGSAPAIPGVEVRDAVPADLPAMRALHDTAQQRADLVRPWSDADWEGLLDTVPDAHESVLTAQRDANVTGWARFIQYDDFGFVLSHGAAVDDDAARALLAAARERAGDARLAAMPRAGDPFGCAVEAVGQPFPWFEARYVKLPDPFRLLGRLTPLLNARLQRSRFASEAGELVLSLYQTSIVLRFADGTIQAIESAPGRQDPPEEHAVGIAPEWLPALLLGRFAPSELERRVDDVTLGEHLELVEVLFPAVAADVEWLL